MFRAPLAELRAYEVVRARGHSLIKATHRTTFEVTKDPELTERGDCIVGVASDKAAADLCERFKEAARRSDTVIVLLLRSGDAVDLVVARGHRALTFSDGRRMVVRKSGYVDGGTVAIEANKAARDLSRDLVERLREGRELEVHLYAIGIEAVSVLLSSAQQKARGARW